MEKIERIDRRINMKDDRIQITSTSLTLLWRIVDKMDELVNGYNEIMKELLEDRAGGSGRGG